MRKGACTTGKRSVRFWLEVRERAVRTVGERRADHVSAWVAFTSIACKTGSRTKTRRRWCREEADRRSAPATRISDEKARLTLLKREASELRGSKEILHMA